MGSWHAYNADGPRVFKNWSITDGTRKIAIVAEQPTTEAEHEYARLIAAAPELLAALQGLCADKYLADPINADRMANARAAIAKATGQ